MMLFTIVEPFSASDGEKWEIYCEWRGMKFERFDSIDGILRPNLHLRTKGEPLLKPAPSIGKKNIITEKIHRNNGPCHCLAIREALRGRHR